MIGTKPKVMTPLPVMSDQHMQTVSSQTFIGTKKIVEAHIKEVAASLDFLRTATDVPLEEKRAFFRSVNKNYGSSALCLSGGASFGYYQYVTSPSYCPYLITF